MRTSTSTRGPQRVPRIALIGCGAIAERYYLPALARQPHALEALALVDQNIDRARKLAAAFGLTDCLSDYREVLHESDGAIIALPTHLHHPIAMEFLSRGVPVLCEKPLAESADKASEMVNQAHRTGAVLATNYQQRLWPQFAKVKQIVADQSLGDPIRIRYHVGETFGWPTVSGFYFNSVASSRGILRDRGAHVLDHICWWLEAKPTVVSSVHDSFGGSEAVAHIKFEHANCTGEVKLSWLSSFPCKFVVEFERGSVEGDVYYPQSILLKGYSGKEKRIRLRCESHSAIGQRMVANFMGAVANGAKPMVSGSDVLESVAFTDACYAAAGQFEMPWYEFEEVKSDS